MLELTSDNKFEKKIQQAVCSLREGRILLTATDTVPGMTVSPFIPQAVNLIYHLKGREKNKPLVWMVSDFNLLRDFLVVPPYAETLIKRYWPGALTLVFELRKNLSGSTKFTKTLLENGNSLAVRIPAGDRYLTALLKKLGEPLAVTSVNRSGMAEMIDLEEIQTEFRYELDYSLYDKNSMNGNTCLNTGPSIVSTVINVRGDSPTILRQGKVSADFLN